MKAIHSMITALGLAFVLPVPADAGQSDPEVILYRFPGVADSGVDFTGAATSFICTNFSGAAETIRFVTRGPTGSLLGNSAVTINHLNTITASTKSTALYLDNVNLSTGVVNQGTTAIAATSTNIICTAMTIDAAASLPNGFALRGIRFSPIPGSQE
jgi:hypothetical protein